MFFFQEGFTYRNFFMDVLTIFVFIMWFWLLISVAGDLFRRHDISGLGKAIWVIVLILVPYIRRLCIFDLARKEHGGAQHAAGSAGA
jgi:hypothetical protein